MMAKRKDIGKKFKIIFVSHSLTRIFRNLLFATVIILVVWWIAPYAPGFFRPPNDIFLIWLAVLFMLAMVVALFLRNRSFIQARKKFILIKVPFYRLKIPYDLVENVRMVLFKDLYDKKTMTWSQRRFLSPYLPRTVVRLNLKKFPISAFFVRLFVPGYLILPGAKGTGFVIYTKQYLELSTEIDSWLNAARANPDGRQSKASSKEEEMGADGFFDLDT